MSGQAWVDTMLLVRTLLYPVAAYGFFCVATYWPARETRSQRLMRQSCYTLTSFFLLAAYKTSVLFAHTSTLVADVALTPLLLLIIGFVYADVFCLSRDHQHNGISHGINP